jgi:hypothetical protein
MQDEDAKQAALDEAEERKRKRYEIVFGLVVAVFAAVLGINELASGKYGDDELKLESEKSGAYLWYQSKGIKQSLAEGQRDLLKIVLGIAGSVSTVLGLHTAGFFSLVPVAMALDGHEVLPAASLRDEIERQKETRVHE